MFVVFDLDGTLSDDTHRQRFIENDPRDWDSYNSACIDDKPIKEVLYFMSMIADLDKDENYFEVWTGRPDSERLQTERWFSKYLPDFPCDIVIRMRKYGDWRPVGIVKNEWIQDIGKPDVVFEDRDSQINFWTERGILVLQVHKPKI